MIWLRTLFLVALWAVVSLLAQWLIGDPLGWIVFSAALTAMLLWRSWRLTLVSPWARPPDTAPPGGGAGRPRRPGARHYRAAAASSRAIAPSRSTAPMKRASRVWQHDSRRQCR
ncbi:hypothetical protein G6F24_016508 [Rhizopus arrhizus]|nr:hypothetical protein G6F24_016508 [Rhizopus arrhizus]